MLSLFLTKGMNIFVLRHHFHLDTSVALVVRARCLLPLFFVRRNINLRIYFFLVFLFPSGK